MVRAFRTRPLDGIYPYVWFAALYVMDAVLRLVGSALIEIDGEWQIEWHYFRESVRHADINKRTIEAINREQSISERRPWHRRFALLWPLAAS